MPQSIFGLGSIYGIPSGANPTPIQFAKLKGISIDVGGELEMLRGEKYFAFAAAKKGGKLSVKIDFAQFQPEILQMVVPGVTLSTGTTKSVRDEISTIPGTPWQVTVANGATFAKDLGVIDTVTGKQMTRGATATGTGVYAVNEATGVYTFNTADATHAVAISYEYTDAANGKTAAIDNTVMAESVGYEVRAYNNSAGNGPFAVRIPVVHFPKCSFGLKSEGWAEHGIEGEAVQDAAGKVAYFKFA